MRRQRGYTLVEFALVAPVLGLVLFGILDFGRAIYYYNGISQAVGESARAASIVTFTGTATDADVLAAAQANAPYVVAAPCPNGPIPDHPAVPSGQAWLYITGPAGGNADFANAPAGETGTAPNACDQPVPAQNFNGDRLRVTIIYNFGAITPMIQQLTGGPLTLSASSVFPVEYSGS